MIAFVVLSLGIHEAAHAWMAYRCGDSTAKDMGRMTLSPFAHIDLFMTVLLPLVLFLSNMTVFGGAKPVPVNPHRLRHPLRDMTLVALAGPVSNLLLAVLFMLIWKALVFGHIYGRDDLMSQVMYATVQINTVLALFNMIPIPPLDGSRVMAYVLPPSLREGYVRLERFGMLLVVGLVFFVPQSFNILTSAVRAVTGWIYVLTGGAWSAI